MVFYVKFVTTATGYVYYVCSFHIACILPLNGVLCQYTKSRTTTPMKLRKHTQATKEEKQALLNFLRPLTMADNIWDDPKMDTVEDDYHKSTYLNKALRDGDSIKVKFTNVMHQNQREETPEEYKTDDGMEWNLYFEDEEGTERMMSQRSTKGLLFKALRAINIQPGQMVTIKRKGEALNTEYSVRLETE